GFSSSVSAIGRSCTGSWSNQCLPQFAEQLSVGVNSNERQRSRLAPDIVRFKKIAVVFLRISMFAAALAVLSLTATMHARAQAGCLTSVEVQKVIASMPSSGDPDKADKKQGKENKKLRKEIIDMYEAQRKINDRVASDLRANQAVIPEANKLSHDNLIRLCSLIKENGWLTSDMLGSDGLAAVTTMVVNNRDYAAQRELLPVLIEAAKRALVPNATVASMIDAIRTAGGSPQIFGTQATMRSDAIYIYPLADPDRV